MVFLLTPLYTKVLSTDQLGVADLVMQTSNLLIPIISVSIANAVLRFGLDKEQDKAAVFTTGLTTVTAGFLLLLVLSPLLLFMEGVGDYIHIVCLYVLSSCLHTLCAQYVRSQGMTKLFAADGILCTALCIGFNILFLVGFKMHITGFLISTVLADAICAVFLFFRARLYNVVRIKALNKPLFKAMLRYSLPLIPTTVLWWITNFSDHYMVSYILSEADNGIYVVAYKIPTILIMVSMVFADAWQMSAVTDDKKERVRFFGEVFYSFQSVVFIGASMLIPLSIVFMKLLTQNPDYFVGWRYMPLLIAATAFNCLVTFQSTVYIVQKRNVNSMWTSLVGAILNITLNAVLIPRVGVNGAAFATFVSYFVIFWLRYFNTRRFIPFNTHLPRVCFNTAVLGVQCWVMLSQLKYWIAIEAVLVLLIIVFNLHPLALSVRKIFEKRNKS